MKIENQSTALSSLIFRNQEILNVKKPIRSILIWIDDWMCLASSIHNLRKEYSTFEILNGYQMVLRLYENACQIFREAKKQDIIRQVATIDLSKIWLEGQRYDHKPQHLSEDEIVAPITAFSFLESEESLYHYCNTLHKWLQLSLNPFYDQQPIVSFETYFQTKKIVEASWLIVQRFENAEKVITKFEDTCPLLLEEDYQRNPYLELTDFFACATPNQYQHDLKNWFKCALSTEYDVERGANLLELHDQLIRIIQAALIIAESGLANDTAQGIDHNALFSDTMHEQLYFLSEDEKAYPIKSLKELLTPLLIKEIRYGLREWLNCSFRTNESIKNLDDKYVFNLFEKLEKIIGLLYILNQAQTKIKF